MKPLKGMNQDVSSANMSKAMYRKAQNFVSGIELDSLVQEPGMFSIKNLNTTDPYETNESTTNNENVGLLGCTPLRDESFLMFLYNLNPVELGAGSKIVKYTASTNSFSTIVANTNYLFQPGLVLSSVVFYNQENEEIVVFTDHVNPIRIINIDSPESDLTLNKLFPEFTPSSISVSPSRSVGGFDEGTHFFCAAYELEDGTITAYHSLTGPGIVKGGAGAFDITLLGVDTDYSHLLIGSISFTNSAIITKVQKRLPIASENTVIVVDNVNPYNEASLEELTGSGSLYTTARTVTIHDNRLYLANLTEHEEASMQSFANQVHPIWAYGDTAPGNTTYNIDMSSRWYPKALLFMPDEVYAFYISYIRNDGSSTRAYHIPGEAPVEITDRTDAYNPTEFEDNTFQSDASCAEIVAAFGDGTIRYGHLGNDIAIQGSGAKFFRTRTTAVLNTGLNGASDGLVRGNMGFWENENEFYPNDFPNQKRPSLGSGGGLEYEEIQLAGEKVRHHKMPSLQWLGTQPTGFVNHDVKNPQMIRVEFDHVIIPGGYSGARIYYAKRTIDNATILGQAPLFHGNKNTYAKAGSGAVNESLEDYTASLGVNAQNQNAVGSVGGTSSSAPSISSYQTGIIWETGRMHPPEMLQFKPGISDNSNVHYIKQEYVLATDSSYPDGEYEEHIFRVNPNEPANYINNLYNNNSFDGLKNKNRSIRFDCINKSKFKTVRNTHTVFPISNSTYLAAGVIDDQKSWDNRGSEEALVFDIDYTQDLGSNFFPGTVTTLERDYSLRLLEQASSPNGEQGKGGIFLDQTAGIGMADLCVSTFAITNFCTNRTDVYSSYSSQELVACTSTITGNTLSDSTTGSPSTVAALSQTLGGQNFGVAGRVTYTQVFGDIAYGAHRTRNTSQVGWNYTRTGNAVLSVNDVGVTKDEKTGTVRISHKYPLFSSINPEFIDTAQDGLSNFNYLAPDVRSINPDQTNDFEYNSSYLKLNDFKQPGIHTTESVTSNILPYRVVRSVAQSNDSKDLNLRFFPVLDSYEQTRSRGAIVNIQSFNDKLIIHHELGLFLTRGQEKIATSAGEITFGSGNIFATKPLELTPSPYGHAGTQHQLSCLLTPLGYFFADESQGKLFQLTDKVADIGALGISNFLKDNLKVRKDLASSEAITNFYPGIQTSYDPELERVIFHLRNFTGSNIVPTVSRSELTEDLLGLTDYFDNTAIEVKDFYLSYSPSASAWTSFHTYNSTTMVGTRNSLYSLDTVLSSPGQLVPVIKVFKHNNWEGPVGKFTYGREKAYIEASFPFGDGAILSDFNWYTKVIDGDPVNNEHRDHDATFTDAIVFNDYQCSGNVSLVKTTSTNSATANMRRSDYKWYFNGFRDLVLDRDESFIDLDGELIDSNIDATKSWYEQRRFVGNFVNVRLILANSSQTTKALHLYDIEAKIRKSYR